MHSKNKQHHHDEKSTQPQDDKDIQNEIPEESTPPTIESLQNRIKELEGIIEDEKLRAVAAERNLHRRHQEELAQAHKYASQKFAEEMLPVKDYLEMALQDQSGNFEALKTGVQMTLNELEKAFGKAHISEIKPKAGDKLDPHQHQALQAIESEQDPNTVVNVMKKGYALSDRVLRPAMVVVAKAPDDEAS